MGGVVGTPLSKKDFMTDNQTVKRILERNLKTVFINADSLEWDMERIGEDDLEFQIVRPNLDKANEAVGAMISRRGLDDTETLLLFAVKSGEVARDALEKWRGENNRPERPDEDVPVLDTVMFTREINREKLRRSMRSPSERDLGTLDNLGDLEPVLLEAINTIFNLDPEQVEAVTPVSDEAAEMFPEGDRAGVGRIGEEVRRDALKLVGIAPERPEIVQPRQSGADPLPSAGDAGQFVADATGRSEMGSVEARVD